MRRPSHLPRRAVPLLPPPPSPMREDAKQACPHPRDAAVGRHLEVGAEVSSASAAAAAVTPGRPPSHLRLPPPSCPVGQGAGQADARPRCVAPVLGVAAVLEAAVVAVFARGYAASTQAQTSWQVLGRLPLSWPQRFPTGGWQAEPGLNTEGGQVERNGLPNTVLQARGAHMYSQRRRQTSLRSGKTCMIAAKCCTLLPCPSTYHLVFLNPHQN